MDTHFATNSTIQYIRDFIASHWAETVRSHSEDEGTLLGLPHPYTIPCRKGAFQELYYWDTYFTSLGLLVTGHGELAMNNARNLLAQVDRFGHVPNGNRTYYLSRSQPPYLAPLVQVIDERFPESGIACEAYPLLKREYAFWTTKRLAPNGLSHHGCHASEDELLVFFETIKYRLGLADQQPQDCLPQILHAMAECEAGWDFNSRFDRRCGDFCPVDLNTNLWLYEILLADWAPAEEANAWREKADQRKAHIHQFCWDDERQVFTDYDFENNRQSPALSAAAFQPLWAGLATEEEATAIVKNVLPILEQKHGVCTTSSNQSATPQQWDYPNAWACVQHLVYRGLDRYGYENEATRIAQKYVNCVCRAYRETGDLWEKYNAVDGSHHTYEESGYLINPETIGDASATSICTEEPPAMMGWTAGVFLDAAEYLETH